jgi:tetratricopeptide (TPR) repeat protein
MSEDARTDSVAVLERIVTRDPATALYLPLAERMREQGRVEEAIRLCESRRGRSGEGVGDRVVLGRCYLAAGRLGEAQAEFEAALELDRENVSALKALAGILSHQGGHTRAADLYRAVCRVDPGDLESQTALHQITSGEYPEVRPPDLVVGQGDLHWQPVRLPREEEHLAELSLGLQTIESFEGAAPRDAAPAAGEFQDLSAELLDVEEDAALPEARAAAPNPMEIALDDSVEAVPPPALESSAPAAPAHAASTPELPAPAPSAPAPPAIKANRAEGNRSAFQEWLKRLDRGGDR